MKIVEFENHGATSLTLKIEPFGDRFEIPPLGRAGVRYTLPASDEDRCYSAVSEGAIDLWCDAASFEFDLITPSSYDKLRWIMCVDGGWCGGLVDGEPTTVDDLLPASGQISAAAFAELAIRADGWAESKPLPQKQLDWLQAKFVEHMGAEVVDVAQLRQTIAVPFGERID